MRYTVLGLVIGVQTCALPIWFVMRRSRLILSALLLAASGAALSAPAAPAAAEEAEADANAVAERYATLLGRDYVYPDTGRRYAAAIRAGIAAGRSKERRVGKEGGSPCSSRGLTYA